MKFRLHNVITFLVLILTVVLSIGFVCASDLQENQSNSADGPVLGVELSDSLNDDFTSSSSNLDNSADNGVYADNGIDTNMSANSTAINDNISTNTSVSKNTSISNNSNGIFNNLKNISISGKVIRCDSGLSFSGVTIKVFDLKGNLLYKTQTDKNGKYNIAFTNENSIFKVTASYSGHVTLSKILNLSYSNGFYKGVCNFQLGPEPVITFNNNGLSEFVNEEFKFQIHFDNIGNETGFGPIVYLTLPSGVQFKNAKFLGSSVKATFVGIFPSNGTLIDPFTKKPVTGIPGDSFYVLEYPLGSYTKGQPIATMEITAFLLANNTIGKPLNITATPVFRFGANETGTTPLIGNKSTLKVTPTVIKITKISNAPESEIATGKSNPHIYSLIIDIANGQTLYNITLKDILPKNLQFIQLIDSATGQIITLPSTSIPGGILELFFNNITGTLGDDKIVRYSFYAPLLDNESQHVINPNTGISVNATNQVNISGKYNSENVSAKDNNTLFLKSVATQKYVKDLTSSGSKPNNILEYLIKFQISDYFALDNIIIYDTLSDGQTFLTNYVPYLYIHLPNGTIVSLAINLNNPNHFQSFYNSTTGITYLMFNITRVLIDNGYGVLEGCNYYSNETTISQLFGNLTFRSQINTNYAVNNSRIVSNDPIRNFVDIKANLANQTANVTDSSGTQVNIVAPTSNKIIIQINGKPVSPGSNIIIRPGDNITFSLEINVPTTNLNNFVVIDYLPIPFLNALQFYTGQLQNTTLTIPISGQWRLGEKDTLTALTGILPYLIVDPTQNTLTFNYGNISLSSQQSSIVHILFTVTATGSPMDDALNLANLLNIKYENTENVVFSDNSIVNFVTGQPVLSIEKNATPKKDLEAGSNITYTIIIKNTGNGTAYNIVVKDNFLNINSAYVNNINNIVAYYLNGDQMIPITGLNLLDLFGPNGLNFGVLYPLGIDATNNTIVITYNVTLSSKVYPLQVINNTVQITNFTSLPDSSSPNFVTDPRDYESNASVSVKGIEFNKTYVGSKNGPSSGNNLTIGEVGKYRLTIVLPAGQIKDMVIVDTFPNGLKLVDGSINVISNDNIKLPNYTIEINGNIITIRFTGLTNTSEGLNKTFYIDFDAIVLNNATSNPPNTGNRSRTNTAIIDWDNPGHTPISSSATINIIEPQITTNKTFSSNTIYGDKSITVTITIKNNGMSKAYNVNIKDYLASASNIFNLTGSNVVEIYTPSGFTFNYDPVTKVVTYTGGNLDVGQSATFSFNLTVLADPVLGTNYTNVANVSYWSLPWIESTPNPDSRNYNSSGSASLVVGDPQINKTYINSTIHGSSPNVTIGENVTYRILVKLPKGNATNLLITDLLPAGYKYISYSLNSSDWVGNLGNLEFTVNGRLLTFKFSGITTSLSNDNSFYIDLIAQVLDDSSNRAGLTKTNNVNLTWDENLKGPFNSSANTYIVEPNIQINKSANVTTVDGGDKLLITIIVTNNGKSNAYRLNISDILDPKFFNSSTVVFNEIPGFTFVRENNVIYIIANEGNFIGNGTSQTFTFTVNVIPDVVSNSTFTNTANVSFSSMPDGYDVTRNYTNVSNVVTFKTTSPNISKSVNSTSEPGSTGIYLLIGEVITYKIDIIIPEGKTLAAVLKDILSNNVRFNSGSAKIMINNINIKASDFNFGSNPGEYISLSDSYFLNNILNLSFGNITFNGSEGLQNGLISIIFNVTVLNIIENQNGTKVANNATLTFTNASESQKSITSAAENLTIITPKLIIKKTPSKTTIKGGEIFSYTIVLQNNGSAPVYDIIITDYLPDGLSYINIIEIPEGWTVINDGQKIMFISPVGFNISSGNNVTVKFNVKASQDINYASKITNIANATGTTLPGEHGTNNATIGNPGETTGERTGNASQGSVNNIFNNVTNVINTTSPSISKNVNNKTSSIGGKLIYTIVINLPEGYTKNLTFSDLLPQGLLYLLDSLQVSSSDSVDYQYKNNLIINSDNNRININFGWVNTTSDGNITLIYTILVQNISTNLNGTVLSNNATIIFVNGSNDSFNSSDTENVTVVEPKLNISKNSDKKNYVPGENVVFTLVINHLLGSASSAYNLVIIDNIPNGLIYKIGSAILPTGWYVDDSLASSNILKFYTFDGYELPVGQNVTIIFNCTVGNSSFAGKNLTNIVALNYSSTNDTNNSRIYGPINANSTIHILGADIYVIKKGNITINAGESFNYYIEIGNNGPDSAINVTIHDLIDQEWFIWMKNVKYYLNGNWYDFNNPLDRIVIEELAPGQKIFINITGTLNSSAPIGNVTNRVNVTSSTPDPNTDNNKDNVTTEIKQKAVLDVKKTVNETVVIAGNSIHYTITIINNGPSYAYDLIIKDNLPQYVVGNFYSLDGGVTWIPWTSNPLKINHLADGDTIVLLINATVNATTPNGTILNNTVNVSSNGTPEIEKSVTSNVTTHANLYLNKSNNPSLTVVAGENLIYKIILRNYGPSVAWNVTLNDLLPVWLLNSSYRYSLDNGVSWSNWISFGGNLALNVSEFFPNGFGLDDIFTLEINSTVNASTPNGTIIINRANATSTTDPDGVESNNVTNTIIAVASLSIVKSGDSKVTAGGPIKYIITIKNNGPSDAIDILLRDALPSYVTGLYYSVDNGITYHAWSPSGEVYLGTLGVNQTVVVWINGTVDSTTPNGTVLNNTAFVTSPTDPESHNDSFITNVTTQANLTVNKSVNSIVVVAGENLIYTIVLTNNGLSVSRNLTFFDNLPNGLINSHYRYKVGNGSWSDWADFDGSFVIVLPNGYLSVGENVTVEINTTVNSSVPNGTVLVNYASVNSSTDPFEVISPPVNTTVISSPVLSLNKSVDKILVYAGNGLIYSIILKNHGPSAAWNVTLSDSIPSWLINASYRYNINGGSWSNWISFNGNLVLDVSSLFPNGFVDADDIFNVEIKSTVNASTPNGTMMFNNATVVSLTTPDEVISPTVNTTVITLANLTITKVANVEKIVRGHSIQYIIVITNLGPSDALNVSFYDYFDTNILLNTYYSTSSGIPWTAFNGPLNLTYLVSSLSPGNNVTIWVNGTIAKNATTGITNTAITSSETDPEGNKSASVKTPIQKSHITIKKTVNNPKPFIHETVYFTLTVKNWGPDTAIGVYAIDKLPDGLRLVSYKTNYGTYNPKTGLWDIGDIPTGETAQLTLTVVVEKLGTIVNIAEVFTDSFDGSPEKHNASATVEVLPVPEPNPTPEPNHANGVSMKNTGMPIPIAVLAILLAFIGVLRVKKR